MCMSGLYVRDTEYIQVSTLSTAAIFPRTASTLAQYLVCQFHRFTYEIVTLVVKLQINWFKISISQTCSFLQAVETISHCARVRAHWYGRACTCLRGRALNALEEIPRYLKILGEGSREYPKTGESDVLFFYARVIFISYTRKVQIDYPRITSPW